jgi:hypothetical protein
VIDLPQTQKDPGAHKLRRISSNIGRYSSLKLLQYSFSDF